MKNFYKNIVDGIKGFLDETEGMALYEVARDASKLGPCLEIGSYCGKSAIYLGAGCLENNQILFSIDHHRGSEEQQLGQEYFDPDLFDKTIGEVNTFNHFRRSVKAANMEETIIPIVSKSYIVAKAWSTPLGLVFIDGSHTFESAQTDYKCWAGHIKLGGYLLIHDIFPDPSQGGQAPYHIYKLALASGLFAQVKMVKTLGVLQRIS